MAEHTTLTGVGVSLRNQISRILYDYANKRHSFMGALKAYDNYYKVNLRFTKSNDVSGEAMQVDFRKSLPTVAGVSALTDTLSNLALSAQENFSVVSGSMDYSHYHMREDVRKARINAFAKDPKSITPYLMTVAQACGDAVIAKLQADIFPAANCAPTLATGSGGAAGINAENRILALAYPLQSGYPANAATGSGTYPYLVSDLNASGYTEIKAVNAGNGTTGFGTPTLSNIRKKLISPLRNRGASPDLGIISTTGYDYLLQQAEAKVVLEQRQDFQLGGEWVHLAGVDWMLEDRLDSLATEEFYILQTDTWEFRMKENDGGKTEFFQNPSAPSLLTYLDYWECALVCKQPRYNGRAYNVSYS